MADSGFDAEVNSIKAFLSMQSPASAPAINPNSIEITAEEYVAPRFARKRNSRQLRQKILESHANVKDLNLLESKMNFVRAWQSLPEYGISLFVVRFHGEKKGSTRREEDSMRREEGFNETGNKIPCVEKRDSMRREEAFHETRGRAP